MFSLIIAEGLTPHLKRVLINITLSNFKFSLKKKTYKLA